MNRIDLEGRRAVVTGGAQGIGRAVAERLIASGAKVMIWDADRFRAEQTAEEIGAAFVDADITDWARVQSATARTMAEIGGVEILVNNAGIAGANAPVADYDDRGMAADHGGQPRRRVSLLQGVGPPHGRRRLWAHRERRVGGGQGGQPERRAPIPPARRR